MSDREMTFFFWALLLGNIVMAASPHNNAAPFNICVAVLMVVTRLYFRKTL